MSFGQMMQSPPCFNPSFKDPNTGVATGISPPQWATEMMEDIKSIKESVAKIEHSEKFVNKISAKVDKLEIRVHTMDTKVTEVEKSSEYVSNQFEDTKNQH